MLGMFWIALKLSNPMVGLITRLSLLAKNLTAFKYGKVAKSGNADSRLQEIRCSWLIFKPQKDISCSKNAIKIILAIS